VRSAPVRWGGSPTEVPGASAAASELDLSTCTATSPDSRTPTRVTEPRKVLVVTIPLPFSVTSIRQPFGPDQHVYRRRAPSRGLPLTGTLPPSTVTVPPPAARRDPVHGADELGHERGGRVGVQLVGRGDLLQLALPHDADPVGHRQRLLLVVGDEQGGGAEALLQDADLLAQLQAHLGVQGGQRLVEQQHPGLDGQRAGQRDALLLTAGQLVRVLPAWRPGRPCPAAQRPAAPLLAPPCASGARRPRCPAPSCSGTGCSSGTPCPCPAWRPACGRCPCRRPGPIRSPRLEAGHDAQGGGLAAARRAEQGDQLAGRDLEGDSPSRARVAPKRGSGPAAARSWPRACVGQPGASAAARPGGVGGHPALPPGFWC
jgi:hypothetical protein